MSDHHLPTTPWTRQSWAFARRNIQQTLRNPVLVFLLVGWPILWYVLTVSLFVDDANGPVKAAMGMTFGLFGAFTVTVTIFAGEFARDLDGDRYRKLRAMAVSPTADLAGRFGSGIVLGVASYVVTVAAALIHGATFVDLDARAIAIVAFTLLVFCLIAMTLALLLAIAIPKPEYMTTISVVLVLLAFYVTGQNGVVPHMIAGDPALVNVLPNSLATRVQITAWIGAADADFMTPPDAPDSLAHVGVLVGYAVVFLAISVLVVKRVAYTPE